MLRINNINAPLDADADYLKKSAAQKLQCDVSAVAACKIAKKSVDARNKNNVHFVYSLDCQTAVNPLPDKDIEVLLPPEKLTFKIKDNGVRPVVIGSGPSGMFAGIALAEAGLKPIIIERGSAVDKRQQDVQTFWNGGVLNPESNVQFGEGGAGTFSDGKLMSGIKKDKYTAKVLQELHAAGAPDEILYLAKPHIGTDKLRQVVRNIRQKITDLGGEYRFDSKLENLIIKDNRLEAVEISNADTTYTLPVKQLFLAIGHSARDTFEMLEKNGVYMQQKSFSVGVRIEHPQSLINRAQYGKFADNPYLGAADYKMAVHLPNGRSVYTFCMCPGGTVVAAASEHGRVVTNGMSEFARNKENANSALLVGVDSRDFESDAPLAGMYFQRKLEELAFIHGGKNYHAPIQRVDDLLAQRPSRQLGDVRPSYQPAVTPSDLSLILPTEICHALRLGIVEMGKKLRGFDHPHALLTAVETRSSSPVRIVRDETMQSNIRGLVPCGEGAGYAGGIMSSAADALKVIDSLNEF
ncbi:MAG: FAD-binding protein [Alphaproteobacteria bacterium]|nr:FAD-binding protein [Alphaproteobacteria bacterium]